MKRLLILIHRADPDREAIADWLAAHDYAVEVVDRVRAFTSSASRRARPSVVLVHEDAIARADDLPALSGYPVVVLGLDRPLELTSGVRRLALPCRLDELLETLEQDLEVLVDPRAATADPAGKTTPALPYHLVRGIAHAINNPLAAASGWLQLLEIDQDSLTLSMRRNLGHVRREINRIEKLSQALSIIGGRPAGLAIPFAPIPILQSLCQEAREAGLDVHLRTGPEGRTAELRGDPAEFELLFDLLVQSYLEDRPLAGRVEIVAQCTETEIAIHFEDDGGVLEVLPDPFDLSLLLRRTRHLRALALSLCEALIRRRHEGSVSVISSALKAGARLELRIPRRALRPEALSMETPP